MFDNMQSQLKKTQAAEDEKWWEKQQKEQQQRHKEKIDQQRYDLDVKKAEDAVKKEEEKTKREEYKAAQKEIEDSKKAALKEEDDAQKEWLKNLDKTPFEVDINDAKAKLATVMKNKGNKLGEAERMTAVASAKAELKDLIHSRDQYLADLDLNKKAPLQIAALARKLMTLRDENFNLIYPTMESAKKGAADILGYDYIPPASGDTQTNDSGLPFDNRQASGQSFAEGQGSFGGDSGIPQTQSPMQQEARQGMQSGMPRPSTPEERDQLPPGTQYIAPDGTIKRKL
jgi:membrane protein involved in colicin uptake